MRQIIGRKAIGLAVVVLLGVGCALCFVMDNAWTRDARFWLDRRNDWGERRARMAAGFGAADCGSAGFPAPTPGANPQLDAADGCALRNFRAGRPFRVSYNHNCIEGCTAILAWHPRRGLRVVRHTGMDTYAVAGCQPSRIRDEQGTDWLGNYHTHRTVGCP